MAMLDDETLYQTTNYVIFDADISFALKEGTITLKKGYTSFGKEDVWDVADELQKGDFVELVADEKMMVQKATGTKPIIGEIIDEPAFSRGTRFPKTSSATWGNYTPRRATIRVFGCYTHELPLVEENVAIQAGDYLVFDADEQAFDKSTKATNVIAIEPKGALESGKIATMMGGFGGIV